MGRLCERNYARSAYVLIISWLLMLTGCGRDVHDHPDLKTGQELFEYHCAECHQRSGQGNILLGVPANKGTELSVYQVSHKIRKGAEKSKMPAFPNMSKEEAGKIAVYLKGLGYEG